jgi:hypothetical protein
MNGNDDTYKCRSCGGTLFVCLEFQRFQTVQWSRQVSPANALNAQAWYCVSCGELSEDIPSTTIGWFRDEKEMFKTIPRFIAVSRKKEKKTQ